MGTNYYWLVQSAYVGATGEHIEPSEEDPRVHIGKRFSAGYGKVGFDWAQDPERVTRACEIHKRYTDLAKGEGGPILRDESGQGYTGGRFLAEVIHEIHPDCHVYDNIGEWFS